MKNRMNWLGSTDMPLRLLSYFTLSSEKGFRLHACTNTQSPIACILFWQYTGLFEWEPSVLVLCVFIVNRDSVQNWPCEKCRLVQLLSFVFFYFFFASSSRFWWANCRCLITHRLKWVFCCYLCSDDILTWKGNAAESTWKSWSVWTDVFFRTCIGSICHRLRRLLSALPHVT